MFLFGFNWFDACFLGVAMRVGSWEEETKGVWKSPRFWFIRLTILAKKTSVGCSGLVDNLLIVGTPFNHRIDDGHKGVP